jgi:hypothetical protein
MGIGKGLGEKISKLNLHWFASQPYIALAKTIEIDKLSECVTRAYSIFPNQYDWYKKGLGLALGLLLAGIASPGLADGFDQPATGVPGRREPGGTRSGSCNLTNGSIPLTMLVPESTMGLTTMAYPWFFWFVGSYPEAQWAEFVLLQEDGESAYRTEFIVSGQEGIVGLQLPKTLNLAPLSVDQNYSWEVRLICEEGLSPTIIGGIKRVEPEPDVATQLEMTQGLEQVAILIENGFWFDTLNILMELQCTTPESQEIAYVWQALLEDEAVKLEHLEEQSFTHVCPHQP